MIRTTFNSSYMQSASDLSRTAGELARRQREVSSGRRINSLSDDPAGASGAVREHSEMAVLDNYSDAADTANARLAITDSVLSDMLEQLTSAKTTVLAAKGTAVTADQRAALANQLSGIRDALLSDFTTTIRGTYLFSGSAATVAPYAKQADGTISAYTGNASSTLIDIDRQTAVAVSYNGEAIARGGDANDVFVEFEHALTAMGAGDEAGMQTALDAFGRAFERVTTWQSQTGASLKSIEVQQGRVGDLRRASEARADAFEKVDLAEAISGMQRADTAYSAALGAIGSTGRRSLMDYL